MKQIYSWKVKESIKTGNKINEMNYEQTKVISKTF